jgi:putative ABC transport system substrate-binding protein
VPVIGFLRSTSLTDAAHLVNAFGQGLKEAGFIEGQNVAIEYRSAEDQADRLPVLVAELLHRGVVLIVGNTPSALAAKATTTTVPIVFATGSDPVADGLVASLNRPGGNVTGQSGGGAEVAGKSVELIRELIPAARRIGVLADETDPFAEPYVAQIGQAVRSAGMEVEPIMTRPGQPDRLECGTDPRAYSRRAPYRRCHAPQPAAGDRLASRQWQV